MVNSKGRIYFCALLLVLSMLITTAQGSPTYLCEVPEAVAQQLFATNATSYSDYSDITYYQSALSLPEGANPFEYRNDLFSYSSSSAANVSYSISIFDQVVNFFLVLTVLNFAKIYTNIRVSLCRLRNTALAALTKLRLAKTVSGEGFRRAVFVSGIILRHFLFNFYNHSSLVYITLVKQLSLIPQRSVSYKHGSILNGPGFYNSIISRAFGSSGHKGICLCFAFVCVPFGYRKYQKNNLSVFDRTQDSLDRYAS